jgi:hypothetical protein
MLTATLAARRSRWSSREVWVPFARATRRGAGAVAAFLHDCDLLGQEWAREGVEQLRRGELIER